MTIMTSWGLSVVYLSRLANDQTIQWICSMVQLFSPWNIKESTLSSFPSLCNPMYGPYHLISGVVHHTFSRREILHESSVQTEKNYNYLSNITPAINITCIYIYIFFLQLCARLLVYALTLTNFNLSRARAPIYFSSYKLPLMLSSLGGKFSFPLLGALAMHTECPF